MSTIITSYLLKVAVGSALLWIVFFIFYRNDTFYTRNRFLLLFIILFPLAVPLLPSLSAPASAPNVLTVITDSVRNAGSFTNSLAPGGTDGESGVSWVFTIWISGVVLMSVRFLISLASTLMLLRSGSSQRLNGYTLVTTGNDHSPFSFLWFLAIPEKDMDHPSRDLIINHELVHIKQFHTADLILAELFTTALWFSPFSWLTRRSIILNHEYMADNSTCRKVEDIKVYQYNLLGIASGRNYTVAIHNFNTNIKNRIKMINTKRSPAYTAFKNLILVPAVLAIILAFSPAGNLFSQGSQKNPFSAESLKKVYGSIYMNISYPATVRSNGDTGTVMIILRAKPGGIIETVDTYSSNEGKEKLSKYAKIPSLDKVFVMGYGNGSAPKADPVRTGNSLLALKEECIKTCSKLAAIEIPEWSNAPFEFKISIQFSLK
ncbi:MAG: M56 family metallopeptidase [Bacteroidales bacterium]